MNWCQFADGSAAETPFHFMWMDLCKYLSVLWNRHPLRDLIHKWSEVNLLTCPTQDFLILCTWSTWMNSLFPLSPTTRRILKFLVCSDGSFVYSKVEFVTHKREICLLINVSFFILLIFFCIIVGTILTWLDYSIVRNFAAPNSHVCHRRCWRHLYGVARQDSLQEIDYIISPNTENRKRCSNIPIKFGCGWDVDRRRCHYMSPFIVIFNATNRIQTESLWYGKVRMRSLPNGLMKKLHFHQHTVGTTSDARRLRQTPNSSFCKL